MVSRFSLSDTGELVDSTGKFSLSSSFVEDDWVIVKELVDFLNKQDVLLILLFWVKRLRIVSYWRVLIMKIFICKVVWWSCII